MVNSRGPPSKRDLSNSKPHDDGDKVRGVKRPTSKNNIRNYMMEEREGRTDITANIRA